MLEIAPVRGGMAIDLPGLREMARDIKGAGTTAVRVTTETFIPGIAARLTKIVVAETLDIVAIVQRLISPNSTAIDLDQGTSHSLPIAIMRYPVRYRSEQQSRPK